MLDAPPSHRATAISQCPCQMRLDAARRHNKKKDGRNRKTISSTECEIGGYRITIGETSDNGKVLALQLTDNVVSFIASWMQPLMRKVIDSFVDEPAASALDAVADSQFQLPSCPTPNVYDKVTWETVTCLAGEILHEHETFLSPSEFLLAEGSPSQHD